MSKNQEDPKDQEIQGLFNQDYDSSDSDDDNIPVRKKQNHIAVEQKKPQKRQKKTTVTNEKQDIIKVDADDEESYHTSQMSDVDNDSDDDSDDSEEIKLKKKRNLRDKNKKKKVNRLKKRRNNEQMARELLDEEAQDSDEEHHQNYKNKQQEDEYIDYIKKYKKTGFVPEMNAYEDRLDEYEKERQVEEYEEQKQIRLEQKPKIVTTKQLQTDPKIFMLSCAARQERQLATSLMLKYQAMKNSRNPLKIVSAIAIDKMPGHIFIEAYQKEDVMAAIDGMLYLNQLNIKLIPSSEVDQILQPNPKNEVEYDLKQFVKIKRGLYHGDYAQIESIDLDSKQVELKLIPRIGPYEKSNTGEIQSRPPQKLFNQKDFSINETQRIRSSNLIEFRKEKYNTHGFLIKYFNFSNIEPTKTNPPLEIVQSFNRDNRKPDRQNVLRNLHKQKQDYNNIYHFLRQGDMVKIKDGQHIGKKGKILDCDENQQIVRIVLLHMNPILQKLEEEPQPKIFRVFEFEKIFQIGDHVEIISGEHQNETGIIIKINDDKANIITDGSNKELIIFVNNLARVLRNKVQIQQDIKKQKKQIQKFDLVKLIDQKTIGVVISLKNNIVTLIDTEGAKKQVDLIDIENKIDKKSFYQNNRNQIIEPKTVVKVLKGREKDQSASVLHVYRDKLFLNTIQQGKMNRIRVVDGNDCYVVQSSEVHNPNIEARFNNTQSKLEQDENSRRRENPNLQMVRLIGQKRKIMSGKWKGYEGVIKQVNETRANFELSAVNKVISIPLKDLNISFKDKSTMHTSIMHSQRTSNYNNFNSPYRSGYYNTPMHNPSKQINLIQFRFCKCNFSQYYFYFQIIYNPYKYKTIVTIHKQHEKIYRFQRIQKKNVKIKNNLHTQMKKNFKNNLYLNYSNNKITFQLMITRLFRNEKIIYKLKNMMKVWNPYQKIFMQIQIKCKIQVRKFIIKLVIYLKMNKMNLSCQEVNLKKFLKYIRKNIHIVYLYQCTYQICSQAYYKNRKQIKNVNMLIYLVTNLQQIG